MVATERPRSPKGSRFNAERGSSACSSTNTERLARRNSRARNKPTGPAPAIITSWELGWRSCMNCSFVDVRPERSSGLRATPANDWALEEASDVRRGGPLHEAKDQSFRYRKDLGLPNQVCLFRHRHVNSVAIDPQRARPLPKACKPEIETATATWPEFGSVLITERGEVAVASANSIDRRAGVSCTVSEPTCGRRTGWF
jgi:hypothetical protein